MRTKRPMPCGHRPEKGAPFVDGNRGFSGLGRLGSLVGGLSGRVSRLFVTAAAAAAASSGVAGGSEGKGGDEEEEFFHMGYSGVQF
jgi:hypothetical protein